MITVAPPLSALTMIMSSLFLRFLRARCSSFVRLLFGGFVVLRMIAQSYLTVSLSTSDKFCMLSSISQMIVSVGMFFGAMAKFSPLRRVLASISESTCCDRLTNFLFNVGSSLVSCALV